MSYVKDNLTTGERIVYSGRLHWIVYTAAVLLGAFGLVLLFAGVTVVGIVFLSIGLIAAVPAYVAVHSSEFAVTDHRVLIKVGWIARRSIETLLPKVEGIEVEQTVPGRIFGYGTIVVRGTGGTHERFKTIARPLEFRRQVQTQINAAPAKAETRPAQVLAPGREERECPYCAEIILAKARVCKHCGRDLQI